MKSRYVTRNWATSVLPPREILTAESEHSDFNFNCSWCRRHWPVLHRKELKASLVSEPMASTPSQRAKSFPGVKANDIYSMIKSKNPPWCRSQWSVFHRRVKRLSDVRAIVQFSIVNSTILTFVGVFDQYSIMNSKNFTFCLEPLVSIPSEIVTN